MSAWIPIKGSRNVGGTNVVDANYSQYIHVPGTKISTLSPSDRGWLALSDGPIAVAVTADQFRLPSCNQNRRRITILLASILLRIL